MYRVYLNDILQDEKDVIGISDGAEFSIVREFGIGNSEQILRDKTDVQLKFTGAAYQLLCTQRAENYCATITIRIEFSCDGSWEIIFQGIIHQKSIELNFNKCIANITAIRDNSFSGLVRDYLNTDIGLYNTKTIGCDDLSLISQTYTMFDDPNDMTSKKQIIAFDVLDVLQYYLNYITNNQVQIVSNYLTGTSIGDVRFAITTGYNMHNTTGTLEETTPMLSFQKLFEELRKKLKIYMGIEYDANGIAYLRIEKESYFFENTELISILDTPVEIIEKLDSSLLYNQINVGSTTWEIQDSSTEYYPQDKLISWREETYTNCGDCNGDKDSVLELVSDFIIDSNVIYEALQEANGSDYANDDSIFMFHYYIDNGQRIALVTNDDIYGQEIYNEEITNEEVLNKWNAIACAAIYRNPIEAFTLSGNALTMSYVNTYPSDIAGTTEYSFLYINTSDSGNNISSLNVSSANSYGQELPNTMVSDYANVFTVPENGVYNFLARANITFDYDNLLYIYGNFKLIICVYSDNTLTTLINEYEDSVNIEIEVTNPTLPLTQLMVNTGEIPLNSGNVVFTKLRVDYSLANAKAYFYASDALFALLNDGNACNNIEQSTSTLPFVVELKHPICYSDFKTMKENKRGYITVNGQPYWIREIKYRPGKLSDLVLLGANTICQTC